MSLAACSNLPRLSEEPSSYRLGAGDTVEIKVLGADELSGRYSVQDHGTIKVLMIGDVPAANLTAAQLENESVRNWRRDSIANGRRSL